MLGIKTKTFHGVNGPYLTVHNLWARGDLTIDVHHFHRGDEDPDCHDHPFAFWSFVLWGGYREYASDGTSITRRPLSLAYRSATHQHRVALLRRTCWTLCIKVAANREWGFWTAGGFVPWKDYLRSKGLEPLES